MGCFSDEPTNHILLGAKYQFGANALRDHCLNTCFQSGFRYAGVLNATHCHCGDELESKSMNVRPTPLSGDACNSLTCPVSCSIFHVSIMLSVHSTQCMNFWKTCSGQQTPINVFRTGLLSESLSSLCYILHEVLCCRCSTQFPSHLLNRWQDERSKSGRKCNRLDSCSNCVHPDGHGKRSASGQTFAQCHLQSKSLLLHPC